MRKVVLQNGDTRWRVVVDAGTRTVTLADGRTVLRRRQVTKTYDTQAEARRERARIAHETHLGTFVAPSKQTVGEYLDGWLKNIAADIERTTAENYAHALRPVREQLGARPLQSLTRADLTGLRDWLLTAGRRRGGTPGSGLGVRTVKLTMGRFSAVLDAAVEEGLIGRNPCKGVRMPKVEHREDVARWTVEQVRVFLTASERHRLGAGMRLSCYGLRRGEVCGLQWRDIDLAAGTVTIQRARVVIEGGVLTKTPKSANGHRTLPLDPAAIAALASLRASQDLERRRLEREAPGGYLAAGWVVAAEDGSPVHPESFGKEFHRVAASAGLPLVTLHAARHACLTNMEQAGVPISIISKWAGHHSAAFTYENYVTSTDPDALTKARDALAVLHGV